MYFKEKKYFYNVLNETSRKYYSTNVNVGLYNMVLLYNISSIKYSQNILWYYQFRLVSIR